MDQWLDSLSEDWVSQPRSQHSSLIVRESPSNDRNESQSRIPRPKLRTVSGISATGRGDLERPSSRISDGSQRQILKARTQSELNVTGKRTNSSYTESKSPRPSTKRSQSHKDSPISRPSTLHGTIQHKTSPAKGENIQATPEWKKRLVNGQAGSGGQTDLFSPKAVSLEGVFKPPTIAAKSPNKNVGNRRMPQREKASDSLVKARKSSKAQPGSKVNGPRDPHAESKGANATGSEQDLSNNFSPIYISRQDTADGRVGYAAIEESMQRLRSNMDRLRREQQEQAISQDNSTSSRHLNAGAHDRMAVHNQKNEVTAESLPDDLSVGTDTFAAEGGFVSLKRGGYSDDSSPMKKTLTPSSSPLNLDGPSLQREGSQLDRGTANRVREPKSQQRSPSPRTPNQQKKAQSSPERPQSSGSPLKLFDKYDTFTNDRLMRRMSKFEEALERADDEHTHLEYGHRPITPSPGPKPVQNWVPSIPVDKPRDASGASSFGDGGLDKYVFPNPPQREPVLPQLPRLSPAQIDKEVSKRRQSTKRKLNRSFHPRDGTASSGSLLDWNAPSDQFHDEVRDHDQANVRHTIHGKRLPYSPVKDPVAKRRRTIHSSEERRRAESLVSLEDFELETQETPSRSLVGRKRKDALYDKERQAADPRVLAMRQIRRPRNPTPNQASSSARYVSEDDLDTVAGATHESIPSETDVKVDPPTQIVAGALAIVALSAAQDMTSGSRKASVTTADFFSEAQQIMRLIRAERRPHSSHATAEASQLEPPIIHEESVIVESTRDDFSRPPSREGGSPPKPDTPVRLNARVVSHLRKYEDKDDLGLALSSSPKSLKMSRSRTPSDNSFHKNSIQERDDNISDPPNARILERTRQLQSEHRSASSQDCTFTGERRHIHSQRSEHLTERSIPTGSSGSSSNRLVIAPETVAHLLSDQMAGMVFDRERQMWIKRKGSINAKGADETDLHSEESEEDLFGDIPDLTVNEMDEILRVKYAVSAGNKERLATSDNEDKDIAPPNPSPVQQANVRVSNESRPVTADGKSIAPVENSSAPSKYSHFASSGPAPSTRATSWGDEYWPQKSQPMQVPTLSAVDEHVDVGHTEEVEHEISILEGRVTDAPNMEGHKSRKARVVTVAFSSPLVDRVQSPSLHVDWIHDDRRETPTRQHSHRYMSTGKRAPTSHNKKHDQRSLSRRKSNGDQSYIARPMSRVDEHEEMSVVQYSIKGNRTMEIAISTPLPISKSLLLPSSTGQRSSIGFHLSPLPDFTVHQIDRPVDVAISKQHNQRSMAGSNNKLSLTAQDLVRHLTDLEPYEPYWEYIRSVDLHDRGLTSLHMLDEFCGQAEELDVSYNQIGELSGVPPYVRLLNTRGNRLSDLSAWHHLQHLQYLDISSNGLTGLNSLQTLVHLRALKADDNAIASLEGLEGLDGLLSLRLRGNRLRFVDFEHLELYVFSHGSLCNTKKQ